MKPKSEPNHSPVAPDAVVATKELSRRPVRAPDHGAESRALVGLALSLADAPEDIFQRLADTILDLCRAHSSGVSLVTDDRKDFYWAAAAGRWALDVDGGTVRMSGQGGTGVDRHEALLMSHPERYFTYLRGVTPPIEEALLVPFSLDGHKVGVIWAISHDDRRFDAEDLHILESLGAFAAAAYQQAHRAEASLQRREEQVAKELEESKLLQSLAVDIPAGEDSQRLFERILDAAMTIMHAQHGSVQLLESVSRINAERAEGASGLKLLASRGFPPEAMAHWQWVDADDETACGRALATGRRTIVPDIELCDSLTGTIHLEMYRRAGIRSMMATPLYSRHGVTLGMLCTHWSEVHKPSQGDLHLLDILVRQAADLIERARAEEALRESEAKYRTLFQSVDEGFCVMEVVSDDRGNITDLIFREVNSAFERHTGLRDAVGKRVRQILPNLEQHWIDAYTRVATTGEPVRIENYSAGIDRWYSVHLSRIGGDGSRSVAVVFEDISARKRQERDQAYLLKLSDELRPLTDAIAIQHTASRILGEHLGVSRAFYFATELQREGIVFTVVNDFYRHPEMPSLIGRHPAVTFGTALLDKITRGETLVVPDVNDLHGLSAPERQAYLAISVQAFVVVPLIKDGEYVAGFTVLDSQPRQWRADEVALVEETAARTWAAVERAHAENALRASQDQLQEAGRRKDEFLAMLAHELRNPLAPLQTGLELIRVAGSTPESVERVRAAMDRQIRHMVRLIDDLLDVSRFTSGRIQLQRQPTPLADLINRAVEANRAPFDAAHIQLNVHIPDEPYIMDIDRTRMVQVLSNLLHNAAKFTPPHGHVEISARSTAPATRDADGRIALTVSDDGAGISEKVLPRIFDLFTQGDHTQPGLGIGLALARRLVEMHGGRIEASSEGPGRGSVFTIELPVARHLAQTDSGDISPRVEPVVSRRVLIVDDNEDAAESLAMLIEVLGGQARIALNGHAGLQAVTEFRPDLVLLDIGMPGIDGYETCRRIRLEPFGRDVLIVALTGWGQEQDKRRAIDAGFDAHLTKPADPAVLERILSAPVSDIPRNLRP
ncbi:MAG TPA: GAF domain-containing protein [Vicinamibacterales bacterium]